MIKAVDLCITSKSGVLFQSRKRGTVGVILLYRTYLVDYLKIMWYNIISMKIYSERTKDMKKRILNKELAEVVAQIRHGEMSFIADAGSGTSPKALYPLDPSVRYIDLEVVTGSPSMQNIVDVLVDVGDFEGAIVTEDMLELNQRDYQFLVEKLGEKNVHVMHYIPEYYEMRDRCKAVVQTGDYGVHAQCILIAGYLSADIPMNWLKCGITRKGLQEAAKEKE